MANAQLKEDTLIPVVPGVTAEHVVLDSLQRQAHEQVLEIMSSYQHSHSHRRRSSVEAAAAASSVLASIANSSAAANKAFSGDLSDNPQHSAAAALLAASGMHGVMLPTIPSESVSLRNTPGPAESFESPFGTTQNAAPTNQQHQRPPPLKLSQIGDDDDLDSDDSGGALAANGMPLTPDAPGSGRPGSLRHLTPDERRARRLQRNRLAAKECRQKKKAYITNLESQVNDLQMENAQLRKELEELNAKLTLSSMRAASTASTPTLDIKTVDMNGTDDASSLSAKRARFSDSSL
ncbi:hypothetical protein GGI07_003049 [Coemansia sp. Benny D115]|nr:hypothetical protein GGI07_003049 [Coemansia sp. Benny D115]